MTIIKQKVQKVRIVFVCKRGIVNCQGIPTSRQERTKMLVRKKSHDTSVGFAYKIGEGMYLIIIPSDCNQQKHSNEPTKTNCLYLLKFIVISIRD